MSRNQPVNYYGRTRSRPDWLDKQPQSDRRGASPRKSSTPERRSPHPLHRSAAYVRRYVDISREYSSHNRERIRERSRSRDRRLSPERTAPQPQRADTPKAGDRSDTKSQVAPESRWSHPLPRGDAGDALLVRYYLLHHYCGTRDLAQITPIAETLSRVLAHTVTVVGSHGSGTASRRSKILEFVVRTDADRTDLVDVLKAAQSRCQWSSVSLSLIDPCGIVILLLAPRGVEVHVTCGGKAADEWISRTNLVKVFAYHVEPRISVCMCLLRDWIDRSLPNHANVDYAIFLVLFYVMTKRRIIPSLISGDDGESIKDRNIWGRTDLPVDQVRALWYRDGIRVHPRMEVKQLMELFVEAGRERLDPETELLCPLTGKAVLTARDAYRLFRLVCHS